MLSLLAFKEGITMLVLAQKPSDPATVITCTCGCRIGVFVSRIDPGKVRIGYDAPPEVTINRATIQAEIDSGIGPNRPPALTPELRANHESKRPL
jgi:sRNA-binding carbon storage regulator CsrA